MRLDRLASGGIADQTLLIERSRFGVQRLKHSDPSDSNLLPIAVELPGEAIFETTINLPGAAIRNINEAVLNRIENLSPLPAEKVVYAISEPKGLANGRIEASVAIVRKSLIEAVLRSSERDRIAMIGANADQIGRFSHIFADRPLEGRDRRKFKPILALCAGAIFFFVGATHQTDKRADAENSHRELLQQTIRAERLETAFLDNMPTTIEIGLSGQDIDVLFARLESATPSNSWIENVEITSGGVIVTGFALSGADWRHGTAPTLNETPRPNIQSFSLTLAAEGAR